jgi:hypothetical protein
MLNATIVPAETSLCVSQQRHRLLDVLLYEIRQVFPQISYELDATSRTVNAQALARGDVQAVRLYGGFALHPMIGEDALIFALLHETGHHFAKGRRFALDPNLACECAADKWALTVGAVAWLRAFGRRLDICKATDSLGAAIASTHDGSPSMGKNVRHRPLEGCWAATWQVRRSRLCSGRRFKVGNRCRTYCNG